MPVLSIIGNGRIAAPIRQHLARAPGWSLGKVLVRHLPADVPEAVIDPEAFLAHPADLILDAAGPGALRQHGVAVLGHANLWTIGAGALADVAFLNALGATARRHGRSIRLFSNGLATPLPRAERLHITVRRPGLGETWQGSLQDAVLRYPHELNSAVAAAVAGPGVARSTITMEESGQGGEHALYAAGQSAFGNWQRVARFDPPETYAMHPVSAAILEALRRETQPFSFD